MLPIILFVLAGTLTVLAWHLIKAAPRALSLFLPRGIVFVVGAVLFVTAIFAAFLAAYTLRDPMNMLYCFVQGYVGLWLMLAPTAAMRGHDEDEQMLRRLFLMMGLMIAALIAVLYAGEGQSLALVNLTLITAGFWVTTNYLRSLGGGR